MNLEAYKRYLSITNYLADYKTQPFPLFQTCIENKLNNISYTQFLHNEDQYNPPYFIRLKKPSKKNSKERGLRLCMINDSVFTEKCIKAGTTIIKLTPLLKVISFSNNYCCECGKCLIDLENAGIKLTDSKRSSATERNDLKKCLGCNLRVFCSEECKIAANLKWHNFECIFLQYLRSVMITQQQGFDCFEMNDSPYEKSILLILTSFRLLLLLEDEAELDVQLIASLTDHFEIYENFIDGESANIQQNDLYTSAKNCALLIQGFFADEQKMLKESLGDLNERGLARLFLVVFVNASTLMNCLNNDIGLMFDPAFSMINHSCNPNCTIVWNDQCRMNIKLTRKLIPGDELVMNYIPIYMPKEMRQVQLKDAFFFQCECERCRITDKKFDSMLPLQCNYCGQHNRGFLLKNLEINDSLPNMDKKIICTNCESVIEAEVVFTMYVQIMNFFREINPSFEDIEMLAYWNITEESVSNIKSTLLNKGVLLWKDCFEIVSLKSWPMSMLTNLVKTQQQLKDPYSLSTLRLTYLSGFLIENMLEKGSAFKTDIGSSIYDLAVSAADFLFDQYLLYRREIDETILSVVGWGTFSLCILSFKHLSVRFDNENNEGELSHGSKIEKAQRDMIQLSGEILFLFNHLGKIKGDLVYNNNTFAKHIGNFETYMDCGYKTQLKSLLIPLEKLDYARFKLTETLSNDSTVENLNFTTTYLEKFQIPTSKTGYSAPPVLLQKPRWINEL